MFGNGCSLGCRNEEGHRDPLLQAATVSGSEEALAVAVARSLARVEAWMARASAGISHQGAEPKPAPTEKPETAEPVEPEIEAPAEPLPVVHVEARCYLLVISTWLTWPGFGATRGTRAQSGDSRA